MGNERKRSFRNPLGTPAEPTDPAPSAVPDSDAKLPTISVKDIVPPGAERLRYAASLFPEHPEQFHDYAKFLADRIGDREVGPGAFAIAVDLALYDLQTGEDGYTGKPIQHRLVPMHPATALTFRVSSSMLASEAYSQEFGAAVHEALYPPEKA